MAWLDTKPFRVVVSSILWNLDKRRISGVAVTRHPFHSGTYNRCRPETRRSSVTVGFPSQAVVNHTAPAFRELLLNRLSPLDDQHNVGVVVRLEQRETLDVIEAAIYIDGLDLGVKAVEDSKNSARTLLAVSPSSRQRTASVYRLFVTRAYSVP